jgi:hypothetical protein
MNPWWNTEGNGSSNYGHGEVAKEMFVNVLQIYFVLQFIFYA